MCNRPTSFEEYIDRFVNVLRSVDPSQIRELTEGLGRAYDERRLVFVCGNGGSGATASHICEDFGKSTLDAGEFEDDEFPRLRILSLTDNTPYILAWANDEGFERVFVEQLKNLASAGDVLISLSGSGNSANVLQATEWASRHGLVTWGVTGFDGGRLKHAAQHSLHVPIDDMGMVESIHLLLFHQILEAIYDYVHQNRDVEIASVQHQPIGARMA